MERETLKQRQKLPLEAKVEMSRNRIMEWVYRWGTDGAFVSFSGGKDSTVLLHLVREMYPEVEGVFANTGLEYPEIRKFALSHENVTEVYPRYGRGNSYVGRERGQVVRFLDILRYYGYPLISKEVSKCVEGARNLMGGSMWDKLHGIGAFSPNMTEGGVSKEAGFRSHKVPAAV